MRGKLCKFFFSCPS